MVQRAFLAAIALVIALSASAVAIDVPIENASFEHSEAAKAMTNPLVAVEGVLKDGQDLYLRDGLKDGLEGWKTWAASENGGMARIWNPGTVDRSSQQNNQFYDVSWGGDAPEGIH